MSNDYSKYNHGPIIKLDSIPKEDLSQALNDFSEGSSGLKRCLSVMWQNNLKTLACCAGKENSFSEAYILMDENIDVFTYLSDKILLSAMVSITIDEYNRQAINIIGPANYKEKVFNTLADDILSGKKQNTKILQDKIGKALPQEWKIHQVVYHMLKKMIPTAGPIKKIRLLGLCKALNEGTLEQQKSIIAKCYREIALNQQEEKKHRGR